MFGKGRVQYTFFTKPRRRNQYALLMTQRKTLEYHRAPTVVRCTNSSSSIWKKASHSRSSGENESFNPGIRPLFGTLDHVGFQEIPWETGTSRMDGTYRRKNSLAQRQTHLTVELTLEPIAVIGWVSFSLTRAASPWSITRSWYSRRIVCETSTSHYLAGRLLLGIQSSISSWRSE